MFFKQRKSSANSNANGINFFDENNNDVELFDSEDVFLKVGKATRPLSIILPLLYFILTIALIFGLQAYYFKKTNSILVDKDIESLEHAIDLVNTIIKKQYENTARTILQLSNVDTIVNANNIAKVDPEVDFLIEQLIINREFLESISIVDTNNQSRLNYVRNKSTLGSLTIKKRDKNYQTLNSAILNMSEGEVYFSSLQVDENVHVNSVENTNKNIDKNTASHKALKVSVFTRIPSKSHSDFSQLNPTFSGSKFLQFTIDISRFINKNLVANLSEMEFYLINDKGEYIFKSVNTIPLSESIIDDYADFQSILNNNKPSYEIQPDLNDGIPYPGYYNLLNLSEFGASSPYRIIVFYYDPEHLNELVETKNTFIIIGIVLSILIWFLIWLSIYVFFSPLRQISKAIDEYEEKGCIDGLPIKAKDELGVISRSFYNLLKNKEQRDLDLAVTRQYLEGITNKSPVHLAYVDLHETYHFVNDTMQKFFGKNESELIGLSIEDVTGENYQLLKPSIKKVLAGEAVQHTTEFKFHNKPVCYLKVSLSPSFNEENNVVGFYICGDDISDITLASQQIHNLSQRLEIALVAPGIGVWEYDIATGSHLWDQRMFDIFGIENQSVDNYFSGLKKYIHPDDFDLYFIHQDFSKLNGDVFFEYRIVLPGQSIRWVEAHYRIIKNDLGHATRLIGTTTDITSRKNLEIEKDQALQQAEESTKLKSEFLASMSHEIRTPINGVIGMLGLLQNTSLSQQQKHYASIANSSAESLLMLINDILDFSKIEAGKIEIDKNDFELHDLIGEVAESIAHRAQEKGVEVILDLTKVTETYVKGDSSRIRQILYNLLGNAIKFTHVGEIMIKAVLEEKNGLYQFHCHIIDTGVGIPQNKLHLLFDSFSQADSSTTRKYGGTGLGLAIVKQLCRLMKGDIDVSSNEGEGSQFSFSIELEKSALGQTLQPSKAINNRKILILDNNQSTVSVIAKQLRLWGAETIEANSPKEAIRSLDKISDLNLILLGNTISEINMTGFLSKVKSQFDSNSPPVVLMTYLESNNNSSFIKEMGISSYFPKPATTKDLFYSIEVMLNKNVFISKQALSFDLTDGDTSKGETANGDTTTGDTTNGDTTAVIEPSKISKSEVQYCQDTNNDSDNKTVHILLVEDNPINQEVALGILSYLDFEFDITIANDGIEALLKLNNDQDNSFDLILMDCQMPDMDGYAATRFIRNGEAPNPTIPIIAMTANAMKGDKEKCLSAGMNAYVSKPIDPAVLEKTIQQQLQQHKTMPEINQELQTINTTKAQDMEPEAIVGDGTIWDQKDFMNRIMNNTTIANKLFDLFKTDTPLTINELGDAVESGDVDSAAKLAHKLKGSVSNLGGIELAGIAKKIEQAGSDKNLAEIKELWPKIKPNYNKLLLEIQAGLSV